MLTQTLLKFFDTFKMTCLCSKFFYRFEKIKLDNVEKLMFLIIRDTEDHISWLLQHGWHEKALAVVESGQGRSELLDEVFKFILIQSNF